MVSFAMNCIKYLLFIFNLIFAISGVAILVVGAILQGVYSNYSSFVNEKFTFLPIFVMVAGGVIFIIAFFGCCGTVKENHCMISTFASLLLIILIMEIVAVVGAFIFHKDLKKIIYDHMESSLEHYPTEKDIQKSWDILQTDLQCCGVNGSVDWKNELPTSCCESLQNDETCVQANAYKQGCFDKIYQFIEQNTLVLVIVALFIAFIQVVGIAFACCLAHSIRKGYETV